MGTRANVLHGIASVALDGVDVGYTSDGVEIEKGMDVFEKLVDQELDALDIVPVQYMMTVRTQMAEASLANLYKVWNETNGPATSGTYRTLKLGYQQEIPEHELVFVGKSPEGYTRTYTLWRAKSVESSAHSLKKDDKIVVPVSFRCLPDFDKSEDERYGQIVDKILA